MKKKNLLMTAIAIFGLATITFGQPVPSYIPTSGLVGWWPFNGNANDESGNGNNGVNNGGTLTTDRIGNTNSAYYFSSAGCATRIDATINTSSITTGLTISVWILRVGNGCIAPRVLEFYNTSGNPGTMDIGWDNTGFGNIGSYTSNGTVVGSAWTKPSDNTWTHLVYTNDGSFGRFYQDGVLFNTVSSTGNPILSGNAAFGRMNHPANDAFNGKLDDIGIWNRSLTQQEITNLYNTITLGINENIQSNLFSVFPNPAQSLINVKADNKLIGEVYTIYDNTGRVVLTGKINSHNTIIELGNLSGGIYMFSVGGNMKQTFKIIKE